MLRRTQQAMAVAAIVGLAAGVSYAQTTGREVVFSEDFEDVAMPGWHGARPPAVKFTRTRGPDSVPALTIETREPVSGTLSVRLPAERIARRQGRAAGRVAQGGERRDGRATLLQRQVDAFLEGQECGQTAVLGHDLQ